MSEYTVDWTINVSVGVQTFFFLLFRFIIFSFEEPRATAPHAGTSTTLRAVRSMPLRLTHRNSIEFHFETIDAERERKRDREKEI